MPRRLLRLDLTALTVALAVVVLVTAARHGQLLQPLELQAYDLLLRMRHDALKQGAKIGIIGIDEEDVRTQDFPLSDHTLAELLRRVLAGEPRALGLDLYRDLPEPRDGSQAAELAAVLLPAENIVTLFSPDEPGRPGSGVPAPFVLRGLVGDERVDRIATSDFPADGAVVRRAFLFRPAQEAGQPLRTFNSFAMRLAMLDLPFEAAFRGVPVPEASFSAETAQLGRAVFRRFHGNEGGYVRAGDGGFQFLVDYRGTTEFLYWPLRDVMAGRVPPENFRDRIVLIGGLTRSIKDVTATPLNASCPGVLLHAQIIDQIVRAALEGEQPTRPCPAWLHPWWTLLWSLLGAGSALTLLRWPRGGLAGIGLGGAALVLAGYSAFQNGWWLPLAEPALAYVLTAGVSLLLVFAWERQKRGELMLLFSRHVSRKVADNIWQQRATFLEGNRPKPQALTATVLFTDLVGFSSVAEQMEAGVLMEWLNEGMERLAQHVEDHGGIVDKYIGDAIMAVFGVPVPRTTQEQIAADAAGAIRCALAMSAELELLNGEWRARGWPQIGMRIGIHTGPLVAGSLGTRSRLEFTVIGDTVNTASRIERSSKEESIATPENTCCILIGQRTYELVSGQFAVEEVGAIPLKGKKNLIDVYRVFREIQGNVNDRP